VLGLVVVLPLITHFFRNKKVLRHDKGCDEFDLGLIRLAIFFDTVGFLGYTLARTGPLFTLAGVAASLGGIGSPTLQSALTKHVPAERTGQLLGALGLLHALARIVSPTVFGIIYASTVGKFTQTVFLCLCATFGLAFVLSWFIRPHGKLSPLSPFAFCFFCAIRLPCSSISFPKIPGGQNPGSIPSPGPNPTDSPLRSLLRGPKAVGRPRRRRRRRRRNRHRGRTGHRHRQFADRRDGRREMTMMMAMVNGQRDPAPSASPLP
jgi:hypothetical protein